MGIQSHFVAMYEIVRQSNGKETLKIITDDLNFGRSISKVYEMPFAIGDAVTIKRIR